MRMEQLGAYTSAAMHHWYWLPSGMTWELFEQSELQMPDGEFIYQCLGYGLFALLLRAVFHCLVALPVVTAVGLNPQSEGYVADCYRVLFTLSNKSKMHRFIDTVWRFAFYVFSFSYGMWYIRDTIWYQDFIHCWYQFPWHSVNYLVRQHYIAEFAFYWSALCITLATPSRSDFLMNFVHHVVTLLLLALSWTLNLTRVGSLVLVIHDAADIFLEFGKMLRYLGAPAETALNMCFVVFIVVWSVSRLFFYPLLIYSALFEAPLIVASIHWPLMICVLYGMLVVLQVLHVIWTAMIGSIVLRTLQPDGEVADYRSDDDEGDGE